MAALLLLASPAAAAWHEARSKHFIVYADIEPAALKAYAEKLERFDAAYREARGVPDVKPGTATRVTLFLVRDLREIERLYSGRRPDGYSSIGGFYIPKASGSVAYIPKEGENGKWGLAGESIFFHEYTHHLMLQDADRPLPHWLTEGFAEFFATPRFEKDGSVVLGTPPQYRAEALYATDKLSLQRMLSGDYLYLRPSQHNSIYGYGWLLTHLLSFDTSRRGQLTRYLDLIETGVPAGKAAEDAFGDLKKLDSELEKYFRSEAFTVATIPASKLTVAAAKVRQLSPGEAQLMDVRMQFERGGSHMPAMRLAADARRVARRHPDDAPVHTLLAQLELRAGNPQEALEAAQRAIDLDGSAVPALLAKAGAMMELAKNSPATADWEGIKTAIVRANRLDTENAEALAMFYRTFVQQGVAPPQTAIDGLEYAVRLAPNDHKLRMEAVGRLIDRNDFDGARRLLVPLAHSPHRGKWHDSVVRLFEAVSASDGSNAKDKWKAALKFFDD